MQVLNIIFTVMDIVANAALTYFAVSAWFTLRRRQKDVNGMRKAVAITTTLTMGSHVKSNFDEVNKMKATFMHLVENEQYEEARKLQDIIAHAEQSAKESLQRFKETCGDIGEIIVTQVKSAHGADEE